MMSSYAHQRLKQKQKHIVSVLMIKNKNLVPMHAAENELLRPSEPRTKNLAKKQKHLVPMDVAKDELLCYAAFASVRMHHRTEPSTPAYASNLCCVHTSHVLVQCVFD